MTGLVIQTVQLWHSVQALWAFFLSSVPTDKTLLHLVVRDLQPGMGAYGRAAGATLLGLFSRIVGK